MCNKIAVYLQGADSLVSFFESDKIHIYKRKNEWEIEKTITLPKKYSNKPAEFRREILNIINELDDCRIIAGLELTGIAFNLFDTAGFDIFSINNLSYETLDDIMSDIEQLKIINDKKVAVNTAPIETEISGVYFLDLALLQTEFPEISSKKALKDFFNSIPFVELQLLCNHIPPWIENGGFQISSQKTAEGKIMAKIQNKSCLED